MPNGIDCYNNQTVLIHVAMTHFDWMVAFNMLLRDQNYFLINSLVVRRDNMSHVTCRDVL